MEKSKVGINNEELSEKLADISLFLFKNEVDTAEELKQKVRESLSYEELIHISSNVIVGTVEEYKKSSPLALLKEIFDQMKKRDDN